MYWGNQQPKQRKITLQNPYGWKTLQEMNEGLAALIDPIVEKELVRPAYIFGSDEIATNRFKTAYKQLYGRELPQNGVPYTDFYKVMGFLAKLDLDMDYLRFLRSNPMATQNPNLYSMATAGMGMPPVQMYAPETAAQQGLVPGFASDTSEDPTSLYTADPYMPSSQPIPQVNSLRMQGQTALRQQIPTGFWRGHYMVSMNASGGNPLFRRLEAAILDKNQNQVRARFFVPKVAPGGRTVDDVKMVLAPHSTIAPQINVAGKRNDPERLAELDLGPRRSGLRRDEEVFWIDPMVQGGTGSEIYEAYQATAALHRASGFKALPVGSLRVMRLPNQKETHLVFVLNVPVQTPNGLEIAEVPIGAADWNVLWSRLGTRTASGTVKDPEILRLQARLARVIANPKGISDAEIEALNEILKKIRWAPLSFPNRGATTPGQQPPRGPRVRAT